MKSSLCPQHFAKAAKVEKTMKTLLELRLEQVEKRLGPDSFVVQQLRNQIHAQTTSGSVQELYTTGSVKIDAPPTEEISSANVQDKK